MSIPTTKQETPPKGIGVAKFDLTKTFRNQLFSRVRILYHQYSIKKHSESIFKSKTISILMIIFVGGFFLSDFLRNILKRNYSPYSTLMTMYLPGAISCSNVLYTTLTNFSMIYLMMCKVYTDVGGIK